MSASLAVNLKFGRVLIEDPKAVERVASLLSRPSFGALGRVSARRKDRWLKHAKPSADLIAKILSDAEDDAVSLDSKRGSELTATAEIENGLRGRTPDSPSTIMHAHLVVPIPDQAVDVLVADIVELVHERGGKRRRWIAHAEPALAITLAAGLKSANFPAPPSEKAGRPGASSFALEVPR